MTIEITSPELEALIRERLESGHFHDVEEMLLRTLGAETTPGVERREAVRRMKEFGDKHRLSLGEPVTRELLHEAAAPESVKLIF